MEGGIIPFPDRAMTRVRFETRLRTLTVKAVQRRSPHLIRITLTGDFEGFQSLGFDDHVKLFFPDPVTGLLTLPGADAAEGVKPVARDYTPRKFDAATATLEIDFAVHKAGPATAWAMQAEVGHILHLGGPRGSTVIPLAYDGYILIGDDTALPAISRRLEEMPLGTPVMVIAEVDGPEDQLSFVTLADVTLHWVHRQARHSPNNLNDFIKGLYLPQSDIFVWGACEASQARLIRDQLVDDHGVNPKALKISAYWRKGIAGYEKSEA